MSRSAAITRSTLPAMSDVVALVKPSIMVFSLLTAVGGMSLAPAAQSVGTWIALMLGTALIVGSANTLNMYLERDVDCLMARTRNRPLPGGRMDPRFALAFGIVQALVAVPLLTFGANPLTGFLGVVALISYVNFYTPLKQRTTLATLVGSLPGAMPALMGFTAATNRLELGGLAVFGVLFLWQIPHFHAIALYRTRDYERAGLKILPTVRGEYGTRVTMLLYLIAQVAVSVLVYTAGVAGIWYLVTALALGGAYLAYGVLGLRRDVGPKWARRFFLASIVYLPVLFIVLVIDGIH
jgi:protoheme IX farnesyltransferase